MAVLFVRRTPSGELLRRWREDEKVLETTTGNNVELVGKSRKEC